MDIEAADEPSGFSRRDLLKRGAIVGAAAVWTVPLVQAVSMTPAHAASPSAPSGGGGGGGGGTGGGSGGGGTTVVVPSTPAAPAGSGSGVDGASTTNGSALASTGPDVAIGSATGVGLAAVAIGVGAVAAGAVYNKRRDNGAAADEG